MRQELPGMSLAECAHSKRIHSKSRSLPFCKLIFAVFPARACKFAGEHLCATFFSENNQKKVARALEMARVYVEHYPSDSAESEHAIAPLNSEELQAARHLFPQMTVGIPENHGLPGYAGALC